MAMSSVAAATASKSKRLFGAVCVRFMLPEQGMTRFEVLSRASAFSIDLESTARKANVARAAAGQPLLPETGRDLIDVVGFHPIATSLHVVRPFLFPRYYPEEWLQFVRPEHIRVTLEYRDNDSGELVEEFPLLPSVLAHPTRDVAVLFADGKTISGIGEPGDIDMEQGVERIHRLECVEKFVFAEDGCGNSEGDRLIFGGHLLNTEPHEDDCQPVPAVVVGDVVQFLPEPDLILASTEIVLQPGMCGGPVMNKHGECVGMIEGVVQNAAGIDDGSITDGLAAVLPARVVEDVLVEAFEGRGGERHHPPHDMLYGDSEA